MAGVEGQGPFLPAALYQVSCRLLGCRMANMQPGSSPYAWPLFYRIRGVHGILPLGGGGTVSIRLTENTSGAAAG